MIDRSDAAVEAQVGVPFDVRLPSAPTSGYGWEIAALPPGIELLGSAAEETGGAATGDGDGGVQVFRLEAIHPGKFELRFVLKRRWEQEPIEIEVIEVVATER